MNMPRNTTTKNHIIFTLIFGLLWCVSATAQGTNAALSGVITDPQDGVLAGATITIKNLDTGLVRQSSSNGDGYYRAIGLIPGHYEIRVRHQGFETHVRTGITLTVAQEAAMNFRLMLESIAEEVVVSRDLSGVETTSSTISSLVDERTVRDLPLNGRDMAQLFLLQPGVVNSRASAQTASTGRGTRFSVAGARPDQNLFTIDGTIINDALNNTPGSAQGLLIGIETVKEFRILISNYSAEYTRATGGVFVAVTKSGTNQFHGSVFAFLRNDALDARNFFDLEKPDFQRNQFGLTVGGPIVKDRTFYFGSYEALRENKGITRIAIVPDDNARMGKLPGIPQSQVDPRSQPIINLFPRANGRNFGDGTAEFIGLTKRVSKDDFFVIRLDHTLSDSHSMFIRYLYDNSEQGLPRNFPEFFNLAVNMKQVVTIGERRDFSKNIVNELRFGFNRSTPSEVLSPTPSGSLSLIAGRGIGEIAVSGLSEIGTDRANPKFNVQNDFQFTDDLLIIKGRNGFKTGFSFQHFQVNGRSESRTRGQLRFRSLADLLRFKVRDLQGASPESDFGRGIRQSLFGFYIQDDAKVTKQLTVNLGLRYDLVTSPNEVNGKLANLRNVLDAQVTIGAPYFKPSRNNFAPRVGFAYDVFGDGKTAIRGGFGMFYEQPLYNTFLNTIFRSLPFENRGIVPGSQISSLPVDPSVFKGSDAEARLFQFQLRPTYLMHYNLNIQRDLFAQTVMTVTYLGSRGVNLFGQGDLNLAVPQRLPDGRDFFPEGSQPRNPNFNRIRGNFQGFNSYYNAMNVGIIRRSNKGLHLQASYTFGKSIDERSGGLGRQEYTNGQFLTFDPYNRNLDRGRSDFDVRHTFVANGTYELPIGKESSGWVGQMIRGWQINAIVTLASGLPINPLIDGDPDGDGSEENTARPNLALGTSLVPPGGRTPEMWFNPAAFLQPEIGFRGTAGRNILTGPDYKSVDLSIVKVFHLTEKRTFQLRAEVFNLFNRANFDLPSNSELGEQVFSYIPASGSSPGTFIPTPTAGKIFSTVGDSREIQVALKFIF